jgi:hypothetical protein
MQKTRGPIFIETPTVTKARLLNNSTTRSARSNILSLFGSNAATANGRRLGRPGNFTTGIAIPSTLLRMLLAGGRMNHKAAVLRIEDAVPNLEQPT